MKIKNKRGDNTDVKYTIKTFQISHIDYNLIKKTIYKFKRYVYLKHHSDLVNLVFYLLCE